MLVGLSVWNTRRSSLRMVSVNHVFQTGWRSSTNLSQRGWWHPDFVHSSTKMQTKSSQNNHGGCGFMHSSSVHCPIAAPVSKTYRLNMIQVKEKWTWKKSKKPTVGYSLDGFGRSKNSNSWNWWNGVWGMTASRRSQWHCLDAIDLFAKCNLSVRIRRTLTQGKRTGLFQSIISYMYINDR